MPPGIGWAGVALVASAVLLGILYRGPRETLHHAVAFLAGAAVAAAVGPGGILGGPGELLRDAPWAAVGRIGAGGLAALLALRLQMAVVPASAAEGGWLVPDRVRYVLLGLGSLSAGFAAQRFSETPGSPLGPSLLLLVALTAFGLGEARGRGMRDEGPGEDGSRSGGARG